MQYGLPVAVHGGNNVGHILQVACGSHSLLQVFRVSLFHAVFICRIADDLFLLCGCHLPCIDTQRDAILFP